jgi:hypothetical protein
MGPQYLARRSFSEGGGDENNACPSPHAGRKWEELSPKRFNALTNYPHWHTLFKQINEVYVVDNKTFAFRKRRTRLT